jgi:F0F1-type ATP synthase delta subunit
MKTPRHQVAALLTQRSLAPSVKARELSYSIAAYLLDTGRTGELEPLMRDMMQDRADEGVVEVTVVSARELTVSVRDDLEQLVRKLYPQVKHVIISERRDPSIIGGVRLEFANQQLDLSVRGRLNRFKQLTAVERMTA